MIQICFWLNWFLSLWWLWLQSWWLKLLDQWMNLIWQDWMVSLYLAQFRLFMPYWFISGSDEAQRMSAKVMHGSLFPRMMICFISFIIGSMATYQQEIFEYFVFTVLNGILGFVIFFFHCTSNETVSFWIFKRFHL